ncbi:hypothetical protein [Zhongshania aquimaris]|uniref:Uncharacterized protein n=1 Tax=Zhongshania aquimaris TaxID=2857107 RepID=A0ABS6VS45_9GAMM|nr:hypothetical protein [Zhongshania aquimaris]MBW2940859.1 hypothetical protein [Zhongshania aquimaris]
MVFLRGAVRVGIPRYMDPRSGSGMTVGGVGDDSGELGMTEGRWGDGGVTVG